MKKILMFLIMLLAMIKVNALDVESNLADLNNKFSELETRMDNYENSRLDKVYPVGSIIETASLSSASEVSNALGGTWESYGAGRVLVGINISDTNFNTIGKVGGNSSITLTTANIPGHTHSIPVLSGTVASAGAHSHSVSAYLDQNNYNITIPAKTSYFKWSTGWSYSESAMTNMNRMGGVTALTAGGHKHNVTTVANNTGSLGSGSAFTNLQPYVTVYRYKRIS